MSSLYKYKSYKNACFNSNFWEEMYQTEYAQVSAIKHLHSYTNIDAYNS